MWCPWNIAGLRGSETRPKTGRGLSCLRVLALPLDFRAAEM